MLTIPRAMVLAAALVSLATLAPALMPRYELSIIDNGTGYARVDRWTARIALTAPNGERGPSPWLTIE